MDPIQKNIAHLREDYSLASLHESDIDKDPFRQFQKWFSDAVNAAISDVNAMTLCTVDKDSKPHSRIVLLKGIEQNGFAFFTNYNSHKGLQMKMNPNVSLVFHWKELQRQVRIEGYAVKVSEEESKSYFASRPRESQLGALASQQSEVLESSDELQTRFTELQHVYADKEIPKPPHWGGYLVIPNLIEFWQGRSNRLHDRLCFYLEEDKTWTLKRLNP